SASSTTSSPTSSTSWSTGGSSAPEARSWRTSWKPRGTPGWKPRSERPLRWAPEAEPTMTTTEMQSAAEAAVARYLAEFERRERPAGEQPWVQALRKRARARFAEIGFPNLQQEEW